MSERLVAALKKIADMRDNEDADLDDALLIADKAITDYQTSPPSGMFRASSKYRLEVAGDERPNVVVPTPAPICPLAFRSDTGDWFVATGVYYKPIHSIDGTLFRDIDGGIWRLLSTPHTPTGE